MPRVYLTLTLGRDITPQQAAILDGTDDAQAETLASNLFKAALRETDPLPAPEWDVDDDDG